MIGYDWMNKIEEGVQELSQIPLWGHAPPFPLQEFAEKIQHIFQGKSLQIQMKEVHYVPYENLKKPMGEVPKIIAIELSPLTKPVYWMMANEDITKLTSIAISSADITLATETIQEGFYQYCVLEALHQLDELQAFDSIGYRLIESTFQEKGALAIDVSIKIEDVSLFGRLFFSEKFLSEWKKHFSAMKKSLFEKEGWENLELPIRMEIGSSDLLLEDWKNLHVGDFLMLDRCFFDPISHKGNVTIYLQDTPIFQARLKNNSIKIVDYALYQEKETNMDEEFDESSLPEEEMQNSETESKVEEIIEAKDVALPIHVEIAQMQMNLKKLVELKPGNLIELNIRPEDGVFLTLHGKKIAKAELVKLGEVLGVKILEIKTNG